MIDFSRFREINWAEIQNKHGAAWEQLERQYGLQSAYKDFSETDSLVNIAKQCIYICWDFLFTSNHLSKQFPAGKRIDFLRGWYLFPPTDIPAEDFINNRITNYLFQDSTIPRMENNLIDSDTLHSKLETPLVEHLIMTFSYWFYHCNYDKKERKDIGNYFYHCSNTVFNDINDSEQVVEFRHKVDRKWKRMVNHIGLSLSLLDELGETSFFDKDDFESNMLHCQNWVFAGVLSEQWKLSPFNADKNGTFDFDIKHKTVGDTRNVSSLNRLIRFFSKNQYLPLILRKYTTSTPELENVNTFHVSRELKLLDIMTSGKPFFDGSTLIIPWEKTYEVKEDCTLDCQIERSTNQDIPPVVQAALNCYMIEKVFHLRCLFLMKKYGLEKRGFPYKDDEAVLFDIFCDITLPLRLNAPLLNGALLEIGIDYSDSSIKAFSWMIDYISFWNSVALPVLEELFLWAVYKNIKQDEISSCIEVAVQKIQENMAFGIRYIEIENEAFDLEDIETREMEWNLVDAALCNAYTINRISPQGRYSPVFPEFQ